MIVVPQALKKGSKKGPLSVEGLKALSEHNVRKFTRNAQKPLIL